MPNHKTTEFHSPTSQTVKVTLMQDQTNCLEEAETNPGAWKGFRPTESLGNDTVQPAELPVSCAVCCGFLLLRVSVHDVMGFGDAAVSA